MHTFEFFTVATTLNLPVLLTFPYGLQSQFEILLSCKDAAGPFEVLSNLSCYLISWYWRQSSDFFLQLSLVNLLETAAVYKSPSVLQLSAVFYLIS